MQRCSSCLRVLPVEEFWWKHLDRGERQEWCKRCRRAYRANNRDIEREQDRMRLRKRALNARSGDRQPSGGQEACDGVVATSE
jgi:hypothetical protein